jgi:hypothetical protein
MAGNNEQTSNSSTSQPATGEVNQGTGVVDDATYQQMLDILKDLTNHTHIFYDDYGTACNCNCNCTCCIRGMVW